MKNLNIDTYFNNGGTIQDLPLKTRQKIERLVYRGRRSTIMQVTPSYEKTNFFMQYL